MTRVELPAILFVLILAQGAGCSAPPRSLKEGSALAAPHAQNANTAAAVASRSEGDYAKHVEQLRKRLPSREFSVVVQRPFVVVGDGPEASVKRHAEETVKWAVDLLKKDFFTKDPAEILDIWLFKDGDSYRRHARQLFGSEPTTPYGYYSSAHKALVMNIETGGGTLVHEIVHPFIEANFPGCPAWLNEGLGSLYEQCGEVDGHIRGFTNWRLPNLKRAVRAKKLPAFETLLAMDADAFYRRDTGDNYAQARYLCYYLQEKGLLVRFYRDFHANRQTDRTGYLTLQKVTGEQDMAAFQRKWEKYVLELDEDFRLSIINP
ncbi:MAG TPA: hypothetical protein VE360_15745 [Pyrinomonadaceae bacterium]|nr:hypothetical protein [Pyrinomonadaceae bacterium]